MVQRFVHSEQCTTIVLFNKFCLSEYQTTPIVNDSVHDLPSQQMCTVTNVQIGE